MGWLAETPVALIRAHLRMLPRLEAEQALREAARVGVGGKVSLEAAQELARGWLATVKAHQPPDRSSSPAHRRARLGGMHIGYRRVSTR